MKSKQITKTVFLTFFVGAVLTQILWIKPQIISAAPLSPAQLNDAKKNACGGDNNCLEGFDKGFRDWKKPDLKAACGNEPDSAVGKVSNIGDEYRGCKAGYNLGKATGGGLKPDTKDADKEKAASCDDALDSVLSWILCPIVDSGVAGADAVFDNLIKPLLEDVPLSTNPDDGTYKAWSQFRLIANVLLIGTLLVVVYSQVRPGG